MTTIEHLEACRVDPLAFLAELIIPSAHGSARFDNVMADFQRECFAALAPSLLALAAGDVPPIGRFWWERTKGGSKDSDLACCILWLLAFSPRPLLIQVGAADADQAAELKRAADGVLRLNPWLNDAITARAWELTNKRSGSICEIIAADVAGSHGARPDVLIINELSHIQKQEFAENLRDNAAKVPRGLVAIATNAGFCNTWQELWRRTAIDSPRWFFHKLDRPAPWLDPEEIVEAKNRNAPARFMRLWFGVWNAGGGDAIEPDDIKAAITLAGPLLGPEPGWVYVAGLDVGLKKDAASLVVVGRHVGHSEEVAAPTPARPRIAEVLADLEGIDPAAESVSQFIEHPGSGRLRVARCTLWQPRAAIGGKVDIESIEREIISLHALFQFACVGYDPWQAAYLAERLEKQGFATEAVNFSGENLKSMATATLESFQQRQIDLYDCPELIADIGNLRIVEKQYGFRLISPRQSASGTYHGDTATGLAIGLHIAKRFGYGTMTPARIQGELICYP